MRKCLWNLMILASLMVTSMNAQAETPKYDALYVFGDSYCDVGNIFVATGGAEPAAPYYNGRFSNGPIWLDHVAGFLGLPLKPSILGGTDYAFGGAWATAPQSFPGGTIPGERAGRRAGFREHSRRRKETEFDRPEPTIGHRGNGRCRPHNYGARFHRAE